MRLGAKRLKVIALAAVCTGFFGSAARAEDTKGKWQFGFGISYYATTDYIRSNSDVALAGTVAGTGGTALPAVTSVDDRPDENMLNEPSIKDDFKFDFSASYGLTRWLALELQTGYLNSAVGRIEFYNEDRTYALPTGVEIKTSGTNVNVCGPDLNGTCYSFPDSSFSSARHNEFIPVGQITEIPLMLSGLVRFRPESTLDPYIGLGVGYIFTSFSVSEEFTAKSDEVSSRLVQNASYGEVTDQGHPNRVVDGPGYFPGPMTVDLSDGFEYHIVGGIDYYLNDKVSMYVDARYVWAQSQVDVKIDGAHQVRMPAFDDGRLQMFSNGSVTAPNLWEDNGIFGGTSAHDGLFATEDGNGNRTLDSDPPIGEGHGVLYLFNAGPNPNDPTGTWQAGQAVGVIDCSATPATCPWDNNGQLDSEDENLNGFMDRYLSWGVDICSMPGQTGNPACRTAETLTQTRYVWPAGCGTLLSQATESNHLAEGCPPIPPVGADNTFTSTGADNQTDIYLIQGGKISLGGFSIGMGVKFTF